MTKRRGSNKSKAPKDAVVIKEPQAFDVLFGRGGHVNHNQGNQKYLELVCQRKEEYHNCKKTDKADIAWDIIRQLREQDPCPRFLKKDYSTNLWHVVPDDDVRRKISQCLRERGTPVCPKAKRRKENKTSPPKLRISLRTSSSPRGEAEEERHRKTCPDDEAWQPAGTMVTSSVSTRRSTRLEKQLQTTRKRQISDSLCEDSWEAEEIVSEQVLSLPVEDIKVVPSAQGGTDAEVPGTETCVPPPLPPPKPIRQEGSNRVWSDFLTRSFASFAPSIFDLSNGAENAWEDLLDTSLLPGLAREDDQSHSSGEPELALESHSVASAKRSYSQLMSPGQEPGDCVEDMSAPKRHKPEIIDVLPGIEPVPVNFMLSDLQEPFEALEVSATGMQ